MLCVPALFQALSELKQLGAGVIAVLQRAARVQGPGTLSLRTQAQDALSAVQVRIWHAHITSYHDPSTWTSVNPLCALLRAQCAYLRGCYRVACIYARIYASVHLHITVQNTMAHKVLEDGPAAHWHIVLKLQLCMTMRVMFVLHVRVQTYVSAKHIASCVEQAQALELEQTHTSHLSAVRVMEEAVAWLVGEARHTHTHKHTYAHTDIHTYTHTHTHIHTYCMQSALF